MKPGPRKAETEEKLHKKTVENEYDDEHGSASVQR